MKSPESLSAALQQLQGNIEVHRAESRPGSEHEPVHIRFGDKSHYGEDHRGSHFATTIDGNNMHFGDYGSFILTPEGKRIKGKMTPEIAAVLVALRKKTGYMKKTAMQKRAFLIKTALEIPIEKGDILLTGRYKNKRMEVKDITTDELGQFVVNGQKLLACRIEKLMPKNKQSKKTQALEKKAFDISHKQGLAAVAVATVLGAGAGAAYAKRDKLKKVFNKFVEPQITLTSGGGPGVGLRLRGTPLIADIDPTGPGAGVLVPASAASKVMSKIPWKRAKDFAKKIKNAPGSVYLGAEMAGVIPVPHIGLAAGTDDKTKMGKFIKDFNKEAADTEEAPDGKCWSVRWADGRGIACFAKKSDASGFLKSGIGHSWFAPVDHAPKLRDKKKGWRIHHKPTKYGCSKNSCSKCNNSMNKRADDHSFQKIAADVRSITNTKSIAAGQTMDFDPSEAKIKSENYKKAHVDLDGYKISIENPVGSVRSGTSDDGTEWQCDIKADYGYIKRTKGYDFHGD